uniref:mucin-2-like n=1 Tax=Oncorhynchus gorbuscha TaxID=8017 RepID=UPI001EAECD19|nr:mucin-2-like [Oncorhynchus gorbuscha]
MGWTTLWLCVLALPLTSAIQVKARKARQSNHVNSICSTWGREHFKTFDGDVYQFPGTCEYNLASDCHSESYQEFSVHLKRNEATEAEGNPTVKHVVVTINDLVFHLTKTQVAVNGEIVTLPYYNGGVQLERNAVYTKLYSKVGLVVMWNGEDAVMVELDTEYTNRTCGLCGDFNGLPVHNEFVHNGRKVSPIEFGNRQKVHRPNEDCEDPYEEEEEDEPADVQPKEDTCKEFHAQCDQLLRSPLWSSCGAVVNPEPYIQACVQDLCGCSNTSDSFCVCSTLAEYSRQCSHAGGQPPHWRTTSFCDKQCPFNMVYLESGSPCMDTCTHSDTSSLCEEHLMDGCFCPQGTVFDDISKRGCVTQDQCQCKHDKVYNSGEVFRQDREECVCHHGQWSCKSLPSPATCAVEEGSHVTTFDGKAFTFHGDCYYPLAKVESKNEASPKFTVLVQLVPCIRQKFDTCLKSVVVLLNNDRNNALVITADGKVSHNAQITLPYNTADISVFKPSSFHVMLQTSFGLQVQIQLVPIMQVYVTLDESYKTKTQGLCGNFNKVLSDDMKTPQGMVEGTASSFGNSWKANPTCRDREERLDDPCSLSVENENYAKHWCSMLRSSDSTFAKCHAMVDPELYYKRCTYASCNCEKSEDCLCAVFSSYVRDCATKGVVLSGWRENVCDKYIGNCPASQTYSDHLQRCQLTCSSLASKSQGCTNDFLPVDGCSCPDGLYMDDRGTCVPMDKCPCFHNGVHIKPGKSINIQEEHCVCNNGKLHCRSWKMRSESTCQSPKVFLNCSNDLGVQCTRSCRNPDFMDCFSAECESGCKCPTSLWEDGKGMCVNKHECPCSHDGFLYAPGKQIPNGCNTCTCKSGKWECTDKKCPGTCTIYGSGHYKTFDERTYGFQGKCGYVAVQNKCGNRPVQDKFMVITENIPCGTTGTTCSKSVRVQLGRTELKLSKGTHEVVDLGVGSQIQYRVRTVGLYLIVESDIGIAVLWDRKTTVRIVLEPQHSGAVCGLCGNYNGEGRDDFTTQGQMIVSSPVEFANSWKVSSTCPDAESNVDPCGARPNRHNWAKMQCSIITGKTFQLCHKKVDPSLYFENCVKDSCACDTGGDCECFCTAVAAYAQACTEAGVCVAWRTPEICPVFCDYYNDPGECEWHYSPCHTPCFKTCLNPNGTCDNPLPNLEGCYPQCPPDMPIFDEETGECVEECPPTGPSTTTPQATTPTPTTTPWTPTTTTLTTEPPTTTPTPPTTTQTPPTTTPPPTTTTPPPPTTTPPPPTTTPTTTTPPPTTTTPMPPTTTQTPPTTTPPPPTTTPMPPTTTTPKPTTTTPKPTTTTPMPPTTTQTPPTITPPTTTTPMPPTTTTAKPTTTTPPTTTPPPTTTTPMPPTTTTPKPTTTTPKPTTTTPIPPTTTTHTPTTTTPLPPTTTTTIPTTTPIPPTTTTPIPTTTTPTTTIPTTATPTTTTTTSIPPTTTTPIPPTTTPIPPTTTTPIPPTTTPQTPEPTTTPCIPTCEWSEWYDEDDDKDKSDWEMYWNITQSGKEVCADPQDIECVATDYPNTSLEDYVASTGQVVECDVDFGLICEENKQTQRPFKCFNYKIRVLCCVECLSTTSPKPTTTLTTTAPSPPTTTTPKPPTTTTPIQTTTTPIATTTPPPPPTTTPPTTTPPPTTTLPPTTTTPLPPTTTTPKPPTTTEAITLTTTPTTTEESTTTPRTTEEPTTTPTTTEEPTTTPRTTEKPTTTPTTTEEPTTTPTTTEEPTTTPTTTEEPTTTPRTTEKPTTTPTTTEEPTTTPTTTEEPTTTPTTTEEPTTTPTTTEEPTITPRTTEKPTTTPTTTEEPTTTPTTTEEPTTTPTTTEEPTTTPRTTEKPTTTTPVIDTTTTKAPTTTPKPPTTTQATTPMTTTSPTTHESVVTGPPITPEHQVSSIPTTTGSPTPPPVTCPEWDKVQNETFWLCNCTLARCIENNTIEIIPYECPEPEPITCTNGKKPVLQWDEFYCCQRFVCDCVCEGWGDPHYITFDGLFYSFQGNCTYVLMEEMLPRHHFKIYIDNVNCDPTEDVSCPRSIIVSYRSTVITLKNHNLIGAAQLEALIDGVSLRLPFTQHGVKVMNSGINMVLEIAHLQVVVTFGVTGFSVNLPWQHFGNNTQGHCGTCSNNQADDCMLPGGQLVENCALMADYWPAKDLYQPDCHVPPGIPTNSPLPEPTQKPCEPDSSVCDLLKDSIFAACHPFVSPDNFYKGCVYDSCHVSNPAVECTSLQTYAAACAQFGVCIYWRNHTELCASDCPADKVYKPCGPAEQPTCDDNPDESRMNFTTEGCFCPDGMKLFNKDSGICVDKCGCIDPEGVPREFNERFEYKCQDCVCLESTKTVNCKPKVCSKPPVEICTGPGFVYVNQTDPSDPCCSNLACRCDSSTCPPTNMNCPIGFVPVVSVPEGKCCPEHTCEPKRVCLHKGIEYLPNSKVPGSECQECTCTNKVDPKSGHYQIDCGFMQCDEDCEKGSEYQEPDYSSDDCCGKCVQTHCVLQINGTMQLLKHGDTWSAPGDKCQQYSCVKNGDSYLTQSSNIHCPPFQQANCQPGSIQTAANGCCRICVEKDKACKVGSMKSFINHKSCQSVEEVEMPYCEGSCNTFTKYSAMAASLDHSCACCQESRSSNRTVDLRCLNGDVVPYTYLHVEECSCRHSDCNRAIRVPARRTRSNTLV